ncbi:hypothetical protein M3Y95_00313700 [Aphelenchoides besseyi]|nr:hypothetical protein M3Y95_00313700 [Aphelenchoides besseyi]
MFKERSTRARLGGSGSGGRGGRRRAVRAARPRGNDPKPSNAIRWLQLVVIGDVNYNFSIQGKASGEGFKLKGNGKSSFTVVVKGSASFDKTWIGYKTSVEYSGQSNLTALSFDFVSSF